MSTFPSVVATLTNPNATDRLNAPSHSSLHQSENSEIQQTQTFIGTTSSAVGTLMYDIRAAASNGGGHVQTANTGGTGYTSYTKGDLLVATSSSVLAKLAVSSVNGNVLTVDPTQAAGVKWSAVTANKIQVKTSSVSYVDGQTSVVVVLYSSSILGSTLGINNAVRFTGNITMSLGNNTVVDIIANYGVSSILRIPTIGNTGSVVGAGGVIEGMIVGAGSSSTQSGYMRMLTTGNRATQLGAPVLAPAITGYTYGTGSIASDADQAFTITATFTGTSAGNSVAGQILVMEKIV